jgi:hypothetical protein
VLILPFHLLSVGDLKTMVLLNFIGFSCFHIPGNDLSVHLGFPLAYNKKGPVVMKTFVVMVTSFPKLIAYIFLRKSKYSSVYFPCKRLQCL